MSGGTKTRATDDSDILLDLRGVSRWFGGVRAVDDVSFSLRRGEILGLIGPNGAGKSTVFNTISGVYPATEGTVRFLDQAITNLPASKITHLGLTRTFQDAGVFPELTVLENVMTACLARSTRAKGRAHVEEEARELLESCGLSTFEGAAASDIPHGHERRLSIAIALATKPTLLCLDEPLSGLNEEETTAILALVRSLRDQTGLSVLFIDHNMKAVMKLCDRVVVLDSGSKICDGAPEVVRNDPKMIEAYLG